MSLLMTITLAGLGAAPQTDTAVIQPVVALFVYPAFDTSPIWWASAPQTVLYEDGTVIYSIQDRDEAPVYATIALSSSEYSNLLDSLALSPSFFELSDWYSNLPANYEPPSYAVWAWNGKQGKSVSLEGLLDSTARLFKPNSAGVQPRTPRAFVNAARRLLDFRHPGAVPWHPTQFEIVLDAFSSAGTTTPWPVDWPTLATRGSYRDATGRYHLPFTTNQVREYLDRYAPEAHTRAFELSGGKWFGIVRPIFPGDCYWSQQ